MQSQTPLNWREYYAARLKWVGSGPWAWPGNISTVIGFILCGVTLWNQQWVQDTISVKMGAVLLGGIPAVGGLSIFIIRWLASPYFILRDEKTCSYELRSQVITLTDAKVDERHKAAFECFKKAAELLKHGDGDFPFHALCKAGGHLLETNDLVLQTCGYFLAYGHSHPFAGLDEYVPESQYHKFLVWIHYSPDFDPHNGTDYLKAAEAWRVKMGLPEPSPEGRLSMTLAKALDNVPPLDRKRFKKGLKVSIIQVAIPPGEKHLVTRLILMNDGPTQRTVLEVSFVYEHPSSKEKGMLYHFGAERRDIDGDGPITITPNSEVIPRYRGRFPDELLRSEGGRIGLYFKVSDGKGSLHAKTIPLVTINRPPDGRGFTFTGEGPHPISLDEDIRPPL